eukprot:GILK01007111.1.p1 GENE.GILK01007111.1~~GILK01007111.1.p1  ORF type:complete len:756 (-),score=125.15 GILK01007111.1:128-2395(-)
MANFPLEGDGVIENLFHFLWTKDTLFETGPAVLIPDTIIYKYRQPAFWYFTASDGSIKRKGKSKLVNAKIEEDFLKGENPSGIVAYYIFTKEENGRDKTTIEYFDQNSFHEFLYQRDKVNNGLLQRFIEPKEAQNSITRIIWSPKVCLFEKRVNKRKLTDRRFDMYERAVTYEGAEFHSYASPVRGAILPNRVQRTAQSIVQHISTISFDKYKISRMVLNFKVDAKDRIWLLWCSSIRLHGETKHKGLGPMYNNSPLEIDDILRVPENIRMASSTSISHPVNLHKSIECPSCIRLVEPERMYEVSYKIIVKHDDKEREEAAAEIDSNKNRCADPTDSDLLAGGSLDEVQEHKSSDKRWSLDLYKTKYLKDDKEMLPQDDQRATIPLVIRRLHPRLRDDDFRRYRKDPLFLFKTTHVCEDCYLKYCGSSVCSGLELESKPIEEVLLDPPPLLGTQSLQPERTRRRRQMTLWSKGEDEVISPDRTLPSSMTALNASKTMYRRRYSSTANTREPVRKQVHGRPTSMGNRDYTHRIPMTSMDISADSPFPLPPDGNTSHEDDESGAANDDDGRLDLQTSVSYVNNEDHLELDQELDRLDLTVTPDRSRSPSPVPARVGSGVGSTFKPETTEPEALTHSALGKSMSLPHMPPASTKHSPYAIRLDINSSWSNKKKQYKKVKTSPRHTKFPKLRTNDSPDQSDSSSKKRDMHHQSPKHKSSTGEEHRDFLLRTLQQVKGQLDNNVAEKFDKHLHTYLGASA